MRIIALLLVLASLGPFTACGNGGSSAPPPPSKSVPTVNAISPNSSDPGGPGFTLSVVGSNFSSGSTVQWSGGNLPTTYVNDMLLTANVPASAVATAMNGSVTVVNPSTSGGSSNSLTFTVPCAIPSPTAASGQTKARLGAYYFDGWSGPLTNYHFNGLPLGPYQDRQPNSGWQDGSACAVEQQLAWAHNFGIDFFVFDWYFNVSVNDPGENLNSALQITHSLPDRHGMQYAILYVSEGTFEVTPANWTSAVNEWVSYMTDAAYLRINGIPVLFVLNVGQVLQDFNGNDAAVAAALGQLRSAAQAQGLPGVYVVAASVGDAISWTTANPQMRPEPAPTPPLVLIEAWNEFGEGSHILPTAGDGTSYGDAIASMLQGP